MGPLHYRLVEGYSKSQVEKVGEKMSGAWVSLAGTMITRNWASFLRVNENKTELFSFLSSIILHESFQLAGKELVIMKENDALSITSGYFSPGSLEPQRSHQMHNVACHPCCSNGQ